MQRRGSLVWAAAQAIIKKDEFMLRSVKQLYRDKLGASDGEIGPVKDFYFYDQNGAVRYLVADTGSWWPGRQVLISPHAFGSLHQAGKPPLVNPPRKQIDNSPSLESHQPVSDHTKRSIIPHKEGQSPRVIGCSGQNQ